MVYKVPKSKASTKQFKFEIDGKTYTVPLLRYVSGATIERIAELEQVGGMSRVAAEYTYFGPAGTAVGDAVRTLDRDQLDNLVEALVEESEIRPGESEAS